jgi:hypothetical protein
MVTFVSLYLWLITGVQTVELAVDPRVDHVERRFLQGVEGTPERSREAMDRVG